MSVSVQSWCVCPSCTETWAGLTRERGGLDFNAIDPSREREVKGCGIWDPQPHLPFPRSTNLPPPLRPQEQPEEAEDGKERPELPPGLC